MLLHRSASAQQRTFTLDRVQLGGAPDDGLVILRPYMPKKTTFYGAAALGYTVNPLRAETLTDRNDVERDMENVVQHQLALHLMGGIQLLERLQIGVALPIYAVTAGGDDPLGLGVGDGLERGGAVGDLRLDARVKIFENDTRKFRAGVGGAVFVPTGNAVRFAGDDASTGWLYGNAEYDFGDLFISGLIGPHFRPERVIAGDPPPTSVLGIGSELRWAVGAFIPLRDNEIRLGGTLWGQTGIGTNRVTDESTFFAKENTDFEWLAEIRMRLIDDNPLYFSGGGGTRLAAGYGAPDVRLLAMIGTSTTLTDTKPGQGRYVRKAPDVGMYDKDTDGDGYPDDIDMCPTVKEDGKPPNPTDGCPAPTDRDGDGIMDDVDKCPDDPEDKDDIEDHDGCPETDADKDSILDVEDACPLEPGVANKDPDKNGCPKAHKKIIETESGIQLLEHIQFDTGRATIKPVSFPILDEVVDVLEARPSIRMGVYGHTDSQGGHDMNMQLSKSRAASVVRYLVQKGVDKGRLESDGFGPDKPVDTNDTPEGRAKNRRVEFKIIE